MTTTKTIHFPDAKALCERLGGTWKEKCPSCDAPVKLKLSAPVISIMACCNGKPVCHIWLLLSINDKLPLDECELCGWDNPPFKRFNGRYLCEQCERGETENPEHALQPATQSKRKFATVVAIRLGKQGEIDVEVSL